MIDSSIVAKFESVIAAITDDEPAAAALTTLKHYGQPAIVSSYTTLFRETVVRFADRFGVEPGLDYGCWYGLSTIMLKEMGAASDSGFDVVPALVNVASDIALKAGLDIDYRVAAEGEGGAAPWSDNTFGWALANDVFSFANPTSFPKMIADIYRVLQPGGLFILSDGNNPHHDETATRLRTTFAQFEGVDGVYQRQREIIIQARFPNLTEDRVKELAAETCYRSGTEITEYCTARTAESPSLELAASVFDPASLRVPLHPGDGRSIGAPTDPHELEALLTTSGFQVEILATLGEDPRDIGEYDATNSGRFYLLASKLA